MSSFLLLTSPPASGKTFFLKNYFEKLDEKALVVSPLRALADEMKSNWADRVDVMTPEEYLSKPKAYKYVVFDEIHLWFYWGDSFRHQMWEAFYELAIHAEFLIGLTATITEEMKKEFTSFSTCFDQINWIDYGNQKLKFLPASYLKVHPNFMEKIYTNTRAKDGVRLIFCQYRQEVEAVSLKLMEQGHDVWSCVGGEARAFSQKVQNNPPPEVIVATTVLSHGVNLPRISEVFLTYPVNNIDFWIQMVARGGRRGDSFKVYSVENPHNLNWNFFSNFLAIQVLSLRIRLHITFHQIEEWFLKAS